jgi:hypothetical protein
MPVKQRRTKRRFSEAEECRLWSEFFNVGHDGFSDLAIAGILQYPNIPLDPPCKEKYELQAVLEAERAAERAIAKKAWKRLGRAYLAELELGPERARWALEEFGEPD